MPSDVDIETVVSGMLQVMQRLGGVPHDLLGHAADIDAGAAQGAVLDRRGTGTILGRTLRVREPAAAPADDEQVIFICQNPHSCSRHTGKGVRALFCGPSLDCLKTN